MNTNFEVLVRGEPARSAERFIGQSGARPKEGGLPSLHLKEADLPSLRLRPLWHFGKYQSLAGAWANAVPCVHGVPDARLDTQRLSRANFQDETEFFRSSGFGLRASDFFRESTPDRTATAGLGRCFPPSRGGGRVGRGSRSRTRRRGLRGCGRRSRGGDR